AAWAAEYATKCARMATGRQGPSGPLTAETRLKNVAAVWPRWVRLTSLPQTLAAGILSTPSLSLPSHRSLALSAIPPAVLAQMDTVWLYPLQVPSRLPYRARPANLVDAGSAAQAPACAFRLGQSRTAAPKSKPGRSSPLTETHPWPGQA